MIDIILLSGIQTWVSVCLYLNLKPGDLDCSATTAGEVYVSVLLYVHLKNGVFPISLLLPLFQGSTLYLPNVVTYPDCFLTAYKMTSLLCIVAGTSD